MPTNINDSPWLCFPFPAAGRRTSVSGTAAWHLARAPRIASAAIAGESATGSPRSTWAAFAEEAWSAVIALVRSLPRTEIITSSEGYLHAECRSRLCGFVDDLELHLRPEEGVIAVRCAARLGYSDFGVNRRRVGTLRAEFAEGTPSSGRQVDGTENGRG